MKEKVLEIKKEMLPLKEVYEQLSIGERQKLNQLEEEYNALSADLNEEDAQWVDAEFGVWYGKFLEVETKIFIKPCEG